LLIKERMLRWFGEHVLRTDNTRTDSLQLTQWEL